jgi:probable HAF family extracellular repeat protein
MSHGPCRLATAVLVLLIIFIPSAALAGLVSAEGINDRGQIMGYGPGSPPERHVLLWHRGTVTDLGFGATFTPILGSQGEVAATEPCALGARPVVWTRGETAVLDSCLLETRVVGINARGDVLWAGEFGSGATSFFKAFVWSHGANIPVPVASPNDTQSVAQAMNDAGHVVGWSGNINNMNHRYLWAHGEITPLDSTVSWSLLNNRDQIAGTRTTDQSAVMWDRGVLTELRPLFEGAKSQVNDLNDKGMVVGSCSTPSGAERAVVWEGGLPHDLGTLPGDIFSSAIFVTNSGAAVGQSHTPGLGAFLWRAGSMMDLGSLGGAITFVTGVNERGQIVGLSQTASGEFHPYLWENGTMTDLSLDLADRSARAAPLTTGSANTSSSMFGLIATPNPSYGQMTLAFRAPQAAPCRIEIFDLEGRLVRRLDMGMATGAPQTFQWDGRTGTGKGASAGVYWARLIAGGNQWTSRLVLLGQRATR